MQTIRQQDLEHVTGGGLTKGRLPSPEEPGSLGRELDDQPGEGDQFMPPPPSAVPPAKNPQSLNVMPMVPRVD